MEEKLKYDEEKNKRQAFLDKIKLTLEAEYNAPLKPEQVEQVDKKLVKETKQKNVKFLGFCEKEELTKMIADPDVISNQVEWQKAIKEHAAIEEVVANSEEIIEE